MLYAMEWQSTGCLVYYYSTCFLHSAINAASFWNALNLLSQGVCFTKVELNKTYRAIIVSVQGQILPSKLDCQPGIRETALVYTLKYLTVMFMELVLGCCEKSSDILHFWEIFIMWKNTFISRKKYLTKISYNRYDSEFFTFEIKQNNSS